MAEKKTESARQYDKKVKKAVDKKMGEYKDRGIKVTPKNKAGLRADAYGDVIGDVHAKMNRRPKSGNEPDRPARKPAKKPQK